MLSVTYIDEPAVLADLLSRSGRRGGAEGFVVMDGPRYLGHVLFSLTLRGEGETVLAVLETSVDGAAQPDALDLAVRACVAAGRRRGCGRFCVDMADETLARWWRAKFGGAAEPQPAAKLMACGSARECAGQSCV